MVRYFIFGDLHANYQAQIAIHSDMVNRENYDPICDVLVSAGDLIGYGGQPWEVINYSHHVMPELIKHPGNHEYMIYYSFGKNLASNEDDPLIDMAGTTNYPLDMLHDINFRTRDNLLLTDACNRNTFSQDWLVNLVENYPSHRVAFANNDTGKVDFHTLPCPIIFDKNGSGKNYVLDIPENSSLEDKIIISHGLPEQPYTDYRSYLNSAHCFKRAIEGSHLQGHITFVFHLHNLRLFGLDFRGNVKGFDFEEEFTANNLTWRVDDKREKLRIDSDILSKLHTKVISCLSAGNPRDGCYKPGYVIYDSVKDCVDIIRVPYAHEAASFHSKELGMPEFVYKRFLYGGDVVF